MWHGRLFPAPMQNPLSSLKARPANQKRATRCCTTSETQFNHACHDGEKRPIPFVVSTAGLAQAGRDRSAMRHLATATPSPQARRRPFCFFRFFLPGQAGAALEMRGPATLALGLGRNLFLAVDLISTRMSQPPTWRPGCQPIRIQANALRSRNGPPPAKGLPTTLTSQDQPTTHGMPCTVAPKQTKKLIDELPDCLAKN